MEDLIFALLELIIEMIGWGAKGTTIIITLIIGIAILCGLDYYHIV